MLNLSSLCICILLWANFAKAQDDFANQREHMVNAQIKARGIHDYATLRAMLLVPRHEFVPDRIKTAAYSDHALPIGNGQTISQPYIVAFMTQVLQLKSDDRVLEIGTGSGYQAAILSEIAGQVYTIEIVPALAKASEILLQELGYDNVTVKRGDGYKGWPKFAPFDAIMVTAGAESIPQPLVDQLKVGGRMIIPIGPHHGVRDLILWVKKKNKITTKKLMSVRFVPFTREED